MENIILYSNDLNYSNYRQYSYKRIDPDTKPYFFKIFSNNLDLSKYTEIILHNDDKLYISDNVKLRDAELYKKTNYEEDIVRLYLGVDGHNNFAVFVKRSIAESLERIYSNIMDLLLLCEIS